jgi:hypothetical protein
MPRKSNTPHVCAHCGATYFRFPSQKGGGRFCSRRCVNLGGRVYQRKPFHDRLWAQIEVRGPDECWPWTGGTTDGYGYISLGGHGGRKVQVHRAVWEEANGPIPDGLCVCHSCDNRPCCNLRHHFLGTRGDNLADMRAKGRQGTYDRRGGSNPRVKLTEDDVRAIRERYAAGGVGQVELAREYGVGKTTIGHILMRRNWAHIP